MLKIRRRPPEQRVERNLPGLMIAPDDQQILTGRGIPTGRIVMRTTVVHIRALDDAVA